MAWMQFDNYAEAVIRAASEHYWVRQTDGDVQYVAFISHHSLKSLACLYAAGQTRRTHKALTDAVSITGEGKKGKGTVSR